MSKWLPILFLLASCASTELIESPKTTFIPDTQEAVQPVVLWTSRTMGRSYDYLGIVKSRAWSYEGALDRLVEGGKELKADAVMDVHYEKIGFFSTMQAFAIKFK